MTARHLRSAAAGLLALAVFAACGRGPKKFDPLTYTALGLSIGETLDPAAAGDTSSHNLIYNIYDFLFAYEGASVEKLVPRLAEKVPTLENGLVSADGKIYTIPIRKGVLFHDGSPLTPEDVRYTILRFLLTDPASGPAEYLLQPLLGRTTTRDAGGKLDPALFDLAAKAVRVEGDDVVLRLPAPFPPLLDVLAYHGAVVSKSWVAAHGGWDGSKATWTRFNNPTRGGSPLDRAANGTGPFKLARYDAAGREVLLERNDAYWRGPAKLKRVDIKAVEEFGTRKLMLQAGDADNILVDSPQREQLKGLPGVDVYDDIRILSLGPVVYFSFKVNPAGGDYVGSGRLDGAGVPPDFFADKNVRQGFAYAMDYEGFIRDVLPGPRALGLVHSAFPGHDPNAKAYSLDLAKSKEHFKKAFDGKVWAKGFKLAITYNAGNVPRQVICNILKRNIESLNPRFKLEVRALSWPAFLQAGRSAQLPVYVSGITADYPDPDTFAAPMMRSTGERALAQGYRNPEADRLVEEALRERDPSRRRALYLKLQELEFEDVPHLLIVEQTKVRAQRSWVKGWVHNPLIPSSPDGSYYYELSKED